MKKKNLFICYIFICCCHSFLLLLLLLLEYFCDMCDVLLSLVGFCFYFTQTHLSLQKFLYILFYLLRVNTFLSIIPLLFFILFCFVVVIIVYHHTGISIKLRRMYIWEHFYIFRVYFSFFLHLFIFFLYISSSLYIYENGG